MSVVKKQQNVRTNRTMIVLMLQAGLAAPIGRVGEGEGLQRLQPALASRGRQWHSLVVVLKDHSVETREQSVTSDEDGRGRRGRGVDSSSSYRPIRANDLQNDPDWKVSEP